MELTPITCTDIEASDLDHHRVLCSEHLVSWGINLVFRLACHVLQWLIHDEACHLSINVVLYGDLGASFLYVHVFRGLLLLYPLLFF